MVLFIASISLLRISIFPFVLRLFSLISWNIVTIAALKIFDNFNISVILELASTDSLFSCKLLKFS